MDLLEHAAGVWARRYVVLGVAVLVAVGVFAWRSTAPEQYDATTTVQVRLPDTQTSDPSTQVAFYAQTVGGLTTSRGVVDRALASAGRDDSLDDAVDQVSASLGAEPGFVDITAAGPSGREAAELADALADVLIDQVAADQAADLAEQRQAVTDAVAELGRDRQETTREGGDPFALAALQREREALLGSLRTLSEKTSWRLTVVEPAVAPTSPSAPTPLRDALLAFLLALILAAEAVVARRAFRGSLSARDPATDAGDVAGVPGLAVRPDQAATALTPLLPQVTSARTLTVVQAGPDAHARTAGLLSELLAARGEDVLLLDATTKRPTVHVEYGVSAAPGLAELRQGSGSTEARLKDLPHVRSLFVLPAGKAPHAPGEQELAEIVKTAPQERVTLAASVRSVDDLLDVVGDLGDIGGPTVLDVDETITRKQLRREVETLRGLGLDLVAVTVSTGPRAARGRKPRVHARKVQSRA